jgi:hypothetical protein
MESYAICIQENKDLRTGLYQKMCAAAAAKK